MKVGWACLVGGWLTSMAALGLDSESALLPLRGLSFNILANRIMNINRIWVAVIMCGGQPSSSYSDSYLYPASSFSLSGGWQFGGHLLLLWVSHYLWFFSLWIIVCFCCFQLYTVQMLNLSSQLWLFVSRRISQNPCGSPPVWPVWPVLSSSFRSPFLALNDPAFFSFCYKTFPRLRIHFVLKPSSASSLLLVFQEGRKSALFSSSTASLPAFTSLASSTEDSGPMLRSSCTMKPDSAIAADSPSPSGLMLYSSFGRNWKKKKTLKSGKNFKQRKEEWTVSTGRACCHLTDFISSRCSA